MGKEIKAHPPTRVGDKYQVSVEWVPVRDKPAEQKAAGYAEFLQQKQTTKKA